MAFACQRFGHLVVRGSSRKGSVDKGGQLAKDEMIRELQKGTPGAVTVDGPKGPAFKVKMGIIHMAKQSDSVIIPYTVKAKKFKQFQSWDGFQLPLPFSKILVHYGVPIDVSLMSENDALWAVENNLNKDNSFIANLASLL